MENLQADEVYTCSAEYNGAEVQAQASIIVKR